MEIEQWRHAGPGSEHNGITSLLPNDLQSVLYVLVCVGMVNMPTVPNNYASSNRSHHVEDSETMLT
jgi:hypothetical protein